MNNILLESARTKLAGDPVNGVSPFLFQYLPTHYEDSLWLMIQTTYSLSVAEFDALKRTCCGTAENKILQLIEMGLPDLVQTVCYSTAHIHEHLDDVTCHVREFGLIGEKNNLIYDVNKTSALLANSDGEESSRYYATEGDVEMHVYLYVKDIIRGLGLGRHIQVLKGIEIVRLKSDLWLLTTDSIPILAIEVKTPIPEILDHPKVISQLTQYMKLYRSFRGTCQVFGILTTFTEWKILWLPDCDSYASSRTLDKSVTFEAKEDVVVQNEVSGTSTLSGSDPVIHHYIASAILKAYHGIRLYQCQSLNLPARLVVCANDMLLTWKRINWQEQNKFIFSLPDKTAKNFYLLEDMNSGAHGRLWIATSPTMTAVYSVFVVKIFSASTDSLKRKRGVGESEFEEKSASIIFNREARSWKALGFSYRPICFCGSDALVIPFAVTASSSEVWNTTFLDKIKAYMDQALVNLILSYLSEHTPIVVAKTAIETLSKARICHEDIRWEHVSVVPVYTKPSIISRLFGDFTPYYDLRPSFIDFGKCKSTATSVEAKQEMEKALTGIMP